MKNVLDFLQDNWLFISPVLLEILARVIPTKNNFSIIENVVKFLGVILKNRRKPSPNDVASGEKNNLISVDRFKHVITVIILFCSFASAFGQLNSNVKSIRFFNADSLTVQAEVTGLQLMYDSVAAIYYNTSSNKLRCYATGLGWSDCIGGSSSIDIYAATNYYVDVGTGSDSNNGLSPLTPLKTLNKLFEILSQYIIHSNVIVSVAAGTYPERVTVPPLIYGGNFRVYLNGETTLTDSGTATSGTAYTNSGSNVSPATLNDTGQSWGVNAYQKLLLKITGGTGLSLEPELNYYYIRSNTATSLSIVGDWNNGTVNSSTTYQILTLDTSIDSSNDVNVIVRGDRTTWTNFEFLNSTGFGIMVMPSELTMAVGCYFFAGVGASGNIGVINGGFRALACLADGTNLSNNISFFEAFSFGDYDENFTTSGSFTNSKTGIKGTWIDNSTNRGVQIAESHTRLTGNYFTNNSGYAIEISRIGNSSMYGNDLTNQDINILDQSYLKIHSGNKIRNITLQDATLYKQNAGGWFSSQVASINSDVTSTSYGTGFSASTEIDAKNFYRARIYNSANQSIANTGVVPVTFNSVRYDPSGMKSGNTFVIQQAGFYVIGYNGTFANDSTGTRRVARIRRNGSQYIGITTAVPSTSIQTTVNVTTGFQLAVGDVIDVNVSQDGNGSINLENQDAWSSEFWILRYNN